MTTNQTTSGNQAASGMEHARREIDRLDSQLVQVLAERMRIVQDVGKLKGDRTDSILLDPERERLLQARWKQRAEEAGLSGQFAARVLREVLSHSRRTQEAHFGKHEAKALRLPTVAYQGEPYSYSYLAVGQLFDTRAEHGSEPIAHRTFAGAVEALREGRVDYALLPTENSIAGTIGEIGQLLADSDLYVVDEETWTVEHVLAVSAGQEQAPITHVRSHPVALAQCGAFLRRLSGAISEPWHDTAGAAASLEKEPTPGVAVIASEQACVAHGLAIIQRNVADREPNLTRFLLLAREEEVVPMGIPAKTSLLLSLDHKQGALSDVLAIFAARSINLTRIESRPDPQTPWRYRFFIDLEGHRDEDGLAQALVQVRRHCNMVRVLGTYPMRTEDGEHLKGPEALGGGAATQTEPRLIERVEIVPSELLARGTIPVQVGPLHVGGDHFTMILGPCVVESPAQIQAAAEMVSRSGASMLRGGAFKPRTSPHSFQGLGQDGLDLLQAAGRAVELPVVTELMRIEDLDAVVAAADVIQVGARNMQNYALLRALGRVDKPVLLERGLSATLDELLSAAEYITAGGNQRVILCERGIRTFATSTRSTLDLGAVAVLKTRTHLPVIVDLAHAACVRHLVAPLALAAAAVGADGLIVEAYPNPDEALSDMQQALTSEDLEQLFDGLRPILSSQGRWL